MKRSFGSQAKVLVFIFGLCAGLLAETKSENADSLFSRFSRFTPGCAVQVKVKGKEVYARAFGSQRLRGRSQPESVRVANSLDTRFRLASVTKPLVATALLKIRDERRAAGRSDLLSMAVTRWFGFLPNLFGSVKVKDLLAHTSGLYREPDESGFKIASDNLLPSQLWANEGIKKNSFEYIPGERASYSNVGYMFAAATITVASRQDWRQFMQHRLFSPIGMNSTSVEDPIPLQKKNLAAVNYEAKENYFIEADFENRRRLLGSGGVVSTVRDLGKFADIISSRKFLSQSSWAEAFQASPQSVKPAGLGAYGLGWIVDAEHSDQVSKVSHSGGGIGTTTYFEVRLPEKNKCPSSVVILCNFGSGFDDFKLSKVAEHLHSIFCE